MSPAVRRLLQRISRARRSWAGFPNENRKHTATLVGPSSLHAPAATSSSSSGVTTLPSASTRSATSRRGRRHERQRERLVEVEQLLAVRAPDLEHVAEARVVTSATRAPERVSTVLVASVVPKPI